MGETVDIVSQDGHHFSAYRAMPQSMPNDTPRGGVLVIQEIFGVNAHIRAVCDGYAADGYVAIAPAVFDRTERGVELGYEAADVQRGAAIATQLRPDNTLRDLQATVDTLGTYGKVGVVGYCFGGTMAWTGAANLHGIACAIGYYGGHIHKLLKLKPRVPVMLHNGEQDALIPADALEAIRESHPEVQMHTYPAGHGFNCDLRASYHEPSAKLARERSLAMLRQLVG